MLPGPAASPRVSILLVYPEQAPELARCMESMEQAVNQAVSVEMIVGAGDLGFAAAANRAAASARGEYLLVMSGASGVGAGWLQELVELADRRHDVGAVASRVILEDESLHEAGSVIWRDGSTYQVGRGEPPESRRYHYLRQVDCASPTSLLVRHSTFRAVRGFDERFPRAAATVDLCLAIRRRRERMFLQPHSVVIRPRVIDDIEREDFLARRGTALLREKWGTELQRFADPAPRDPTAVALAIHRARQNPRRLLMIDDRLPNQGAGAGAPRMLEVTRELADAGFAVAFYPTVTHDGERGDLEAVGVEVIDDDLISHLAAPHTLYDVVIVSRPHNFKLVRRIRRYQAQAAVIYDAEALAFRRIERQAEFLATVDPEAAKLTRAEAARTRQLEESVTRGVDRAVALSAVEAGLLRSVVGHCPVDLIEPRAPANNRMTPRPFAGRSGVLLVAGWSEPYPSPNSDGLEWFVEQVLPLVKQRVPWVRLSVTGANPSPEVLRLACPSVRFLGHVKDLRDVYDGARVAVEPVRYGAGVKNKAVEALQYGVPLVASSVGAEGIEGDDGSAVAICDDPERFATQVVALLDDRWAWEAARAAIARLHDYWASCPPHSWADTVESALTEKTIGRQARHG